MKNKIKTLCFDIDQVICVTKKNYYKISIPKKNTIKYINTLYDNGYIIKIFTARYMGTYKENILLIKKKYYKKTFNQLKKWKLKFHMLYMGKPSFDLFIDDKSLGYNKGWINDLNKKLKEDK
tara:strand:+ start:280 stop:645 length:366 start_codon:yes stop_codon:yes gene_type:complete